ncbi:hypothetical protein L6R53_18455 [Myxococcota bacterium]|nr:hypothetical protein [Myxococcota bacterium]
MAGGDLPRLQRALRPVEREAAHLPWAEERRWTTSTHVWLEGGLPVVDLHDLGVQAARVAVDCVAEEAGSLEAGAVCFVTGVGRRSLGPPKLGRAVSAALGHVARQRGWRHGPLSAGRLVLIVDPARAPARATGRLGWPFWAALLAFGLLASALFPPFALVLLAALAFALRQWWRRR